MISTEAQRELARTLKLKPEIRSFRIEARAIDEEARTVEIAISSEEPYQRWWGIEILDHSKEAVNLDRLLNKGALLVEHLRLKHVGVFEKAWVDKDRVCRAVVRLGRSALAIETFNDIVDGIKSHVSVGYEIHAVVLENEEDGVGTYRVTEWEPYEASFVAIPADPTVGVGRSAGDGNPPEETVPVRSQMKTKATTAGGPAVADPPTPAEAPATPAAPSSDDIRNHEKSGADAENQRVTEILDLAKLHGAEKDAGEFIQKRASVSEFKDHILSQRGFKPLREDDGDLGLDEKEKADYDLMRALRAMANPSDRRAQEAAAPEFEISDAYEQKTGREAQGILIPPDILKMQRSWQQRDVNVGTDSQGGYLVDTELRPQNFIELLRNSSAVMPYATILNGLTGDLTIPRQTGTTTTAWVAEGGAASESQLALGLFSLAPKTVSATTDITRKMLLQSSVDIQNLVLMDLAAAMALAIDYAALNGSGAGNEPEGILNMSGIGSVALGANGGAPDWDMVVDLETEVAQDNALLGQARYLGNAKVQGKLKRVLRTPTYGDQMLLGTDGKLNNHEFAMSNQVPSDLTKGTSVGICSALVFGYLATVHVGLWSGLDVLVDPYSQSRAGTLQITAHQDADVGARHEAALSACTDILTT